MSAPAVCAECLRPASAPLRRELCPPCYQRARRAGAVATGLVDAAPTVAHLDELVAAGISQREIARRTGMDRLAIGKIRNGRRATVNITTAAKILAIAIPAAPDLAALAWRELCAAGIRGDYVSPQRKYRATLEARRKLALREKAKRDQLRRERQAQHEARIRELLGPAPPVSHAGTDVVVRGPDLSGLACGDCELMPCRCPNENDYDLGWLPALADHDHPAVLGQRHEGIAA